MSLSTSNKILFYSMATTSTIGGVGGIVLGVTDKKNSSRTISEKVVNTSALFLGGLAAGAGAPGIIPAYCMFGFIGRCFDVLGEKSQK